jgi:hypothetical protein
MNATGTDLAGSRHVEDDDPCVCGHRAVMHWYNAVDIYFVGGNGLRFCRMPGCECQQFRSDKIQVSIIDFTGPVSTADQSAQKQGGERMENGKEWNKVESEIFTFSKVGDSIEGVYERKETAGAFENFAYKIKTDDGLRTVFGTVVLNDRMGSVPMGSTVKIVFVGTSKAKTVGFSDTKMFEVFYK